MDFERDYKILHMGPEEVPADTPAELAGPLIDVVPEVDGPNSGPSDWV